jgi:hypothetical protein
MLPPGTTAPAFRLPEIGPRRASANGRTPGHALEEYTDVGPVLVVFCPAHFLGRGFRRKPYVPDLAWFPVSGVSCLVITGWKIEGDDPPATAVPVPILHDGLGQVADAYDIECADGTGGIFVVEESRMIQYTHQLTEAFDATDLRVLSRRVDQSHSSTNDRFTDTANDEAR